MYTEKPAWVKHGGTQIFSIDIQPGGLRFATGGGDHKVRIWNMKVVGRELHADVSASKLLATLRDHYGSVNCVRWSKHGQYIASGSDDQVILVHERKPGVGTTEFGSGEPPDIENWKTAMTLRGHTADVVDLNWSPDNSTLASGSLDNTIHVWDMTNGTVVAVLRGHSSLVKGVAWDPIGSFMASQSDDKTVMIWHTTDWSLAHRTDGHWAKSLGSTFFRRLDWSPCGHFITTTHGFQKPRHSAPVLERGEWSATFDFLGHNAPIIVAKFNHSMFRRTGSKSKGVKAAAVGWANGSLKQNEGKDQQPYNVIAMGSQDRTITVWTTVSPRPVYVAKHFFSQSVVDLSWSPDGYSLFACSLDGTIATFHFDANEIGHKLTDEEFDDLKRSRYGYVRSRHGNLAETPAQLVFEAEAEAAKQTSSKKLKKVATPSSDGHPKPQINALDTARTKNVSSNNDGKKAEVAISDTSNKVVPARIPSPVKQKEYRRPDGRKRIIPEAVGATAQQEIISPIISNSPLEFPAKTLDGSNKGGEMTTLVDPCAARKVISGNADLKERSGVTARATISESLVIEKVPAPSTSREGNVEQICYLGSGSVLSIRVFDKLGEDAIPLSLEARPKERAVTDIGSTVLVKETELFCLKDSQNLWSERISGKVTVLAGNSNFWAVGCEDGSLQVYTKCGRRALPTMMMGSAAAFVDCDESWKLLLVTRKGSMYLWDLFNRKCLLQDSLASLITTDLKSNGKETGTIKVISAKLSKSGIPLVVLATRHAFLFDMDLKCWLRVADDCFPASNFASSWSSSSAHAGELAALQIDLRKYLARKPGWSRSTDDGMQTRAHLESQMASALAMKSPKEYRQCLLSYIRFLTREEDETRLREVCESFLGPPSGIVEHGSDPITQSWDPFVLGMSKHKLLREDILPAMASNRKIQRLLNEFVDLISEYEAIITQNDNPATDAMDTDAPVINRADAISSDRRLQQTQKSDTDLTDTENENRAKKAKSCEKMVLDLNGRDGEKSN